MKTAHAFALDIEDIEVLAARTAWPSPAWRGRHVEFARDVLGYRALSRFQVSILDAYYAHARAKIAVCSGQKLGKTEVETIAILHDFATEANLNGFVFAPKIDHTKEVLWPRVAKVGLDAFLPCAECMPSHRAWCSLVIANPHDETPRPERCPKCSPLIPSEWKNPRDHTLGRVSDWISKLNPEEGLRAPDGRTVRAYASQKVGAKGGLSGVLRIYADECSDIDDTTKITWDGNAMGPHKRLCFGNLLRGHIGWFGRAFREDKPEYTATFTLSSRLSPNCKGRIAWSDGVVTTNDSDEPYIKGMATPEGIEEFLAGGKRDKNLVAARVDAGPPVVVDGLLTSLATMLAAEQRWPAKDPDGILQFGVDVARARDKFAVAVRRGDSIRDLFAEVLGDDDYVRAVDILFDMATKWRRPFERKPRLVYDASGKEGQRFGKELSARNAAAIFEVFPVHSTFRPRNCKLYDKRRDELACAFAEWLKHGSIPANVDLERQIGATTGKRVEVSYGSAGNRWEVQRVITNDELRELIGSSPDERNACELAVLDVDGSEAVEAPPQEAASTRPDAPQAKRQEPANDVFAFDVGTEPSAWDRYNDASAFARGAQ